MITLFVPSQADPFGHIVHVVRVLSLFPDVKEPVGHVVQDSEFEALAYMLSAPHMEHCGEPLEAYDPGKHARGLFVPSQRLPTGQREHAVRSETVPPEVNDPVAQEMHALASSPEYILSAPQSVHELAPPGENLPAAHTPVLLVPKQVQPPGQREHVARFVAEPPDVYDPTGHVWQVLAPTMLCRLSTPHAMHVLLPAPL